MIEEAIKILNSKSSQGTVLTFELAVIVHEVVDQLPYNQPLKPLLGFNQTPAPTDWNQLMDGLSISQRSRITLAFGKAVRQGEYRSLDELQEDIRTSSTRMERIPPHSRAFLIVVCWPEMIPGVDSHEI